MFTKMLRHKQKLLIILMLSFLVLGGSSNGHKRLIVKVIDVDSRLGPTNLQDDINSAFSRKQNLRVMFAKDFPNSPDFPAAYYNLDSLRNWGAEIGGKYLLLIAFDSRRIETRKTFSIPLIIHKYQTLGIQEGEIRFVDLNRGKLILAESFVIETKGPRVIQASVDDNRYDADIQIAASDKSRFVAKMERELTKYLQKKIGKRINGR